MSTNTTSVRTSKTSRMKLSDISNVCTNLNSEFDEVAVSRIDSMPNIHLQTAKHCQHINQRDCVHPVPNYVIQGKENTPISRENRVHLSETGRGLLNRNHNKPIMSLSDISNVRTYLSTTVNEVDANHPESSSTELMQASRFNQQYTPHSNIHINTHTMNSKASQTGLVHIADHDNASIDPLTMSIQGESMLDVVNCVTPISKRPIHSISDDDVQGSQSTDVEMSTNKMQKKIKIEKDDNFTASN